MKKIPVLLILCLGMVFSLTAQDNAISKYFDDYLDDPTFQQFKVSEKSFELLEELEGETPEEQAAIDALTKLDGILVLVKEKTNKATALYSDAFATIEADGNYEELVSVQTTEENMQALVREELDEIREFLLIAEGDDNFVIASLYGEIDLPNIMHFAKVLKDNGQKWFELVEGEHTTELIFKEDQIGKPSTITLNTDSDKFEDIKVFPNVVLDKVNIQDQTHSNNLYQVEFFSLMGESIQQIERVALPYTLEFNDLPSGAYFIRLTNSEGTYKNFRIVKP